MNKCAIQLTLLTTTVSLSACYPAAKAMDDITPPAEKVEMTSITGQVSYRERIALRPGSVFKTILIDVSIADRKAPVLAKYTKTTTGEQVPLDFTLKADFSANPNNRYAVRATISAPDGTLMWTTDTVNPIDPAATNQNIGILQMVRVNRSKAKANRLTMSSWRVDNIGGTGVVDRSNASISFDENGRISGSTGCNRFTGTYSLEGNAIKVGQLVMSQRACLAAVASQETKFLEILNYLAVWDKDDAGRLILKSADGEELIATPE